MKRFIVYGAAGVWLIGATVVAACSSSDDDGATPVAVDAGPALDSESDVDGGAVPNPCADAGVPPSTLECAGLYSDFANKVISPTARAYTPAIAFWSDGAEKERWIALPANTSIDATNPNEWVFPIGTKLFKQFTYGGRRVETRLFQKVSDTYWVHATYAWNESESSARISYGETLSLGGDAGGDAGTWVIPEATDCDACHRGRNDRVLGFEQVSLGLQGAAGLTLYDLATEGLIKPVPANVHLRIGDGNGIESPALGWLHVNCGVTCHNANANAQGYGAQMLLRLDPSKLDGSPVDAATWDPLRTTVNVACISGSVAGRPRIAPGDPSSSVIVELIGQRGDLQMPPIATRVSDLANVAVVEEWIRSLDNLDAGAADATVGDGGTDDASVDGAVSDAGADAD